MTVPPSLPKKRSYYLRIFMISFAVIGLLLITFLFAVYMESSVTADGIIRAQDQQTLTAPQSGLIRLGWYQAADSVQGKYDRVRVDDNGNGIGKPGKSNNRPWQVIQLSEKELAKCTFHSLQQSDKLYPGQPLAIISSVNDKSKSPFILRIPKRHDVWKMLDCEVESGDYVRESQPVCTIVPVDQPSGLPKELGVDLLVPEEKFASVEEGQTVRIYSNVYPRRQYGHALGKIQTVQSFAKPLADGKRAFPVRVQFTGKAPYPLLPESSVQVRILTTNKPVYRLILEN